MTISLNDDNNMLHYFQDIESLQPRNLCFEFFRKTVVPMSFLIHGSYVSCGKMELQDNILQIVTVFCIIYSYIAFNALTQGKSCPRRTIESIECLLWPIKWCQMQGNLQDFLIKIKLKASIRIPVRFLTRLSTWAFSPLFQFQQGNVRLCFPQT